MGKKKMMKIPFPFKSKEMVSSGSSSWPWPTCASPRTLSFRAKNDIFFKTMNCTYNNNSGNNNNLEELVDTPECASFSSVYREEEEEEEKTVIRGLRSERLFFEPGETSSSILEKAKVEEYFPFKESVAMAVDSRDPFLDFRRSMEEMVEAHELKDWESLEDLLTCYLKVNVKSNHGYIVGAFVDLLVTLAFASSSSEDDDHHHRDRDRDRDQGQDDDIPCSSSSMTRDSFTSPLSFSSSNATTITSTNCSPSLSLVEVDDETEKSIDNASSSDV
ncbi:hypothetical protein ACH5RR_005663 [Cinchona calisaya]|uniref:Transcription repressor n=1 Tax=Cinchona calisaya TaxID=153742 RepID=A0ABD3ALS0_9GENT